MVLSHPGWLQEALGSILAGYDPTAGGERLVTASRSGEGERLVDNFCEGECASRAPTGEGFVLPAAGPLRRLQALRHVDEELRRSGLVYGFPTLPPGLMGGRRLQKDEGHFLAVIAAKSLLVLDVARILGAPFDRHSAEAELTLFFAAAAGREDLANKLRTGLEDDTADRDLPELQVRLEKSLIEQIPSASGDLRFDLPLHNGVAFGEARVMARLALFHYESAAEEAATGVAPRAGDAARSEARSVNRRMGSLGRRAQQLLIAANRERAFLTEALISFTAGEGRLVEAHKQLLRRELRRLRLERALERRLREVLGDPPPLLALAGSMRSRGLRRFVLEQLVLVAALDSERPPSDSLLTLAEAFGTSADELEEIEGQVATHVYQSDDVFDAFEGRAVAQVSTRKWGVDRIVDEIVLNLGRVNQEVRETGELTQLLAKAAMGQKLSGEEKEKVREQLIDLAKVVPSLAILAAPGGTVIFAALLKVLPFSILPSAFQTSAGPPPIPRPTRPKAER